VARAAALNNSLKTPRRLSQYPANIYTRTPSIILGAASPRPSYEASAQKYHEKTGHPMAARYFLIDNELASTFPEGPFAVFFDTIDRANLNAVGTVFLILTLIASRRIDLVNIVPLSN
jgi:hypothetical protein